jgi:hypothetical protein
MTKAGDWAVRSKDETPVFPAATRDDVIQSFRWILGREIQDEAAINRQIAGAGGNRLELRVRILRSAEFRQRLLSLGIVPVDPASLANTASHCRVLDPAIPRFVFAHVPKCGGTSIHFHLQSLFGPHEISRARHNDLLLAPAFETGSARLFSGHFDTRVIDGLPGRHNVVFTMLREPRARLISLYRYLAAHTADRANVLDLKLAIAARGNDFDGFLRAALDINPAAVDNCYARTFGATLPINRWETAAEPSWMTHHARPSRNDWHDIVERALSRLRTFDFVGSMERFKPDCARIVRLCGGVGAEQIEHLKDLRRLTSNTIGFEVPPPVPKTTSPLLDELTRFDRELYDIASGWSK